MSLRHAAACAQADGERHRRLVAAAVETIAALPPGRTMISWSGGKDSTCLLGLACEAVAGRWPPPVVVLNHHVRQPAGPMVDLLDAWAHRAADLTWIVRPALDDAVDDRPAFRALMDRLDVTDVVLGLRAGESRRRARIAATVARTGSYTTGAEWGGRTAHCPILRWSTQDVWALIRSRDLPTHRHYDEAGDEARSVAWLPWDTTRLTEGARRATRAADAVHLRASVHDPPQAPAVSVQGGEE